MYARVTYGFNANQDRPTGWTTNFWMFASDLNAASTQAEILGRAMNDCQGNQTLINFIQVTDDDPLTRLVLNSTVNMSSSFNPPEQWATDFANTGVLVEFLNALGQKSLWPLRGIPVGLIERAGSLTRNFAAWNQKFAAFVASAINMGVQLRVRALNAPEAAITQIGANGAIVAPGHPFMPDDQIHIYGKTSPYSVAGTYRVLSTDTDEFTVDPWTTLPGPVSWRGKVFAQRVDFTYTPLVSGRAVRMTSRNTGRPLGSPVGRR